MKYLLSVLGIVLITQSYAQDTNRNTNKEALDEFRKEVHNDYNSFRRQCMAEYVKFVREAWKEFGAEPPKPRPIEKPVPPMVMPKEEKGKPIKSVPIVIDKIITPIAITPQPIPVVPIQEMPVVPEVVEEASVNFAFFGTEARVRFDKKHAPVLNGVDKNSIANALEQIDDEQYNNTIYDCLALRQEHKLSDWAYLKMLQQLADTISGKGTNEATLLLAYLYMQSGYKMRLAKDEDKLYMLYASSHHIYDNPMYFIDGDKYFSLGKVPLHLSICTASYPKEQNLSLLINTQQVFAPSPSEKRRIASFDFPGFECTVDVNRNLIDFYGTYPESMIDDNFMTRWAMYGNTPIDNTVRESLYPAIKKLIEGMSEIDAANRLLNWVQTGLEYEYDDVVWGDDRVFFAEESLFYPYCDCEDRSILLTRLVRDLMGLKCVLVYYPGHLAAAIEFSDNNVKGDYIQVGEHKYVIADGTFIGAPVGRTMPGMDNTAATVILLE